MILVNGNWERIVTKEDLYRFLEETYGRDVADCLDKVDLDYKDKYYETSYELESLQTDHYELKCKYEDLQYKYDQLEADYNKLVAK